MKESKQGLDRVSGEQLHRWRKEKLKKMRRHRSMSQRPLWIKTGAQNLQRAY